MDMMNMEKVNMQTHHQIIHIDTVENILIKKQGSTI